MSQAQRHQGIRGRLDWHLLMPAIILAAIGVVMVASSSIAVAQAKMGDPAHYLVRHLVHLGIGTVALVIALRIEMVRLEQVGRLWLLLAFIALLLVFMPGLGHTVNGATRWINLGVIRFQAVEVVKLLLILYLAGYLVREGHTVQMRLTGVVKPILAVGGLVVLLLMQPDFGSAMLLVAIAVGMVWLAGAGLRHLGLLALARRPAGLGGDVRVVPAQTHVQLHAALGNPVHRWLPADPVADRHWPRRMVRVAWRQRAEAFYLPRRTDFIVAVLGRGAGPGRAAAGPGAVRLAHRPCLPGRLPLHADGPALCRLRVRHRRAAVGTDADLDRREHGLLPTKGLTLPLISSGGSSLIMTCAALGILLRCAAELDRAERQGVALADAAAETGTAAGADAEAGPLRHPATVAATAGAPS